jgi:hypothetical protein
MRHAIRLSEHKSGQTSLDMESLKYLKIRAQSDKVVITKVVSNYIFFLQKFYGNFYHPLAIFPVKNSNFGV